MNIQRFRAKDSRSGLARIREVLGPDAVILANRRVADGVEILAARDLDSVDAIAARPAGGADLAQLQQELGNLRSLLEAELRQRGWQASAAQSPVLATLNQRLARMGFSRALGEGITDALPANGELKALWRLTLAALEQRLAVLPEELTRSRRVIACIGTTGVGKTSTIAKLAARAALASGPAQVALVTIDQYRIGGQEQLATFADYLGVPLRAVADAAGLQSALRDFGTRGHVFVDTAGMGQRDTRLLDQCRLLLSCPEPIALCAVFSASASVAQLREFALVLDGQGVSGAIITKLDEAVGLGGLLDVLIRTGIPVAYTCGGQRVPDDLQTARASELIALAARWLHDRRNQAGAESPGVRDMAMAS